MQEFEKLTKNQEKEGSFKKGNIVDRISRIKKVAPSPLSSEVLMCKVHWLAEENKETGFVFEPEPSMVPITIVK